MCARDVFVKRKGDKEEKKMKKVRKMENIQISIVLKRKYVLSF